MNLADILNSPESTEQSFKFLSADYSSDVIFSDFDNDTYKRSDIIKLDNVLVMVATSETKTANDLFVNLLQTSKNTSIGTKLFAAKSGIRRRRMTVSQLNSTAINDSFIASYLNSFGFIHNVYLRETIFSCNQQTMDLKEYILPGLKFIFDKYAY